MWLDQNGSIHTVALESPEKCLPVSVVAAIRANSGGFRESLESWISDTYDEIFDAVDAQISRSANEQIYEYVAPPMLPWEAPSRQESLLSALIDRILESDVRWRLDYVNALADVVDESLEAG